MKPFCESKGIVVSVHDAKTLLIKAKLPDFDSDEFKRFGNSRKKCTCQTAWTSLPLLNRKEPENQKFSRFYSSIETTRLGIRIEIGFNLHEPLIEEFDEYAPSFELVVSDKTLALENGDIDDALADTDPEIHDMSDVELCGSVELTFASLKEWINHDDMLWITCRFDDKGDDDIFEYELATETRISFLNGPASVSIKNYFATNSFDFHFVVGEHEIGTHKFVLCSHSVLNSMLRSGSKEMKGKIIIEDVDVDAVREFVNILNTFEATFKNDDLLMAFKVKALAKRYGIKYIEKAASDIYNISHLNKDNFVELFK